MLSWQKVIREGNTSMEIQMIARIENNYVDKFGIPRQSGFADTVKARIVFAPQYRNPDAFRGIEGYSHLWLLWEFSETGMKPGEWTPTVRPPRLGGNKRVGVFATRSPFRPNALGLSSVRLLGVDYDCPDAPVLLVSGADLLSGTPIYDVKPYLPYTDSHPDATSGFAGAFVDYRLQVTIPDEVRERALSCNVEQKVLTEIEEVLSQDPRPAYQNDPQRIYRMRYGLYEVAFTVADGAVTVAEIVVMEDA